MKILYHHRTQAQDGQAIHIRSLMDAFQGEGHQLREVALVERSADAPPPKDGKGEEKKEGWNWIGKIPRFARELAEYAYTVPARGKLLAAAREFKPDFFYERYAFGNAAGVQAAQRLSKPIVLEVNSPMVLELSKTRGLSFPRIARQMEDSIFKRATRVAVVTEVLGEMLVELGVDADRILVTPNGVHPELYTNPDPARARRDLGLAEESGLVLGFVGYYRDWHRLDLVIESLNDSALRDAQLVLIGAGPAEEELRAVAARVAVTDRVHFAGTRKHTEIPGLLPAFDIALVPAINPYASPLKLHEYMAAALAVIAPDQPNLREVLENGKSAALVPPGDADALRQALVHLATQPGLRTRLGANAKRTIEERDLTWAGNARRVVQAVEDLA